MNEFESKSNVTSEDLAHKVLDRIDEEHVVPRPKWQFTIKDRLFWVFWILSVLLGSLLAATLVFVLVNSGWEYRVVTHQSFFGFVMHFLPTVWIAALFVAMLLAYENFRHTSRGYRVPWVTILGASLLITILGGALFYLSGAGRVFEEQVGGRIPAYRTVKTRQKMIWSQPEQGLLAGEVVEFNQPDATLRLKGFDGNLYFMYTKDLADDSRDLLVERDPVRVIGVFAKPTDGPDQPFFRPCYVFPWEPKERSQNLLNVKCDDDERIFEEPRSTECKGLIPYEILKTLRRGACR